MYTILSKSACTTQLPYWHTKVLDFVMSRVRLPYRRVMPSLLLISSILHNGFFHASLVTTERLLNMKRTFHIEMFLSLDLQWNLIPLILLVIKFFNSSVCTVLSIKFQREVLFLIQTLDEPEADSKANSYLELLHRLIQKLPC